MAIRNPLTGKFMKSATPADVANAINNNRLGAAYERQVIAARLDRERRTNARKAGYRGPLTRRDLAAGGYVPTVK